MNPLILDTPMQVSDVSLPCMRRAPAPGRRRIAVGLVCPGRVGRVLLEQMHSARQRLAQDMGQH